MRTGVIAKKIGMTRFYSDNGVEHATTVLSLEGCQVISQKNIEKDGYIALQLGAGNVKPQRLNKAKKGHFAAHKVLPRKKLAEFRVDADNLIETGVEITANHFVEGQKIDVIGISKGKGFAGGIKRHNFSGGRATHGNSISHRSLGSTGGCQDPGKVFKGKKMAGHMGDRRVTTENLEIFKTDVERSLIIVKGAVPGAKGGWVYIRDAVKCPVHKEAPFPGAFKVLDIKQDDAGNEESVAKKEKVQEVGQNKIELSSQETIEGNISQDNENKDNALVDSGAENKVDTDREKQ